MKNHFKRAGIFFVVLILLVTSANAAGAGSTVYQNTLQLADNLTYTNTISLSGSQARTESYMLNLTGSGDAYPIIMACDTLYGNLRIDDMINYASSLGKNVLAAVNTDFFTIATGVPTGIVIEDGVYKSSPDGNTAVAFTSDGAIFFSKNPKVTITLENNGGSTYGNNAGQTVELTKFNKYRTDAGGLYLFSSAFSTESTRTSTDGWFVKFRILDGEMSASGTMTLEVVETIKSSEAIAIGDGYLVLSAAAAMGLDGEYGKFAVGDTVTLKTACSDENLTGAQWATGAGDVLISDGAIADSSAWNKDILNTNPRTAIGVKSDGTVICYVVDGRNTAHSNGLTLSELAEELLRQGCIYAVNFDGGGSSVMSMRLPGDSFSTIVNEPSDGIARKNATYLLFVTDKVSDGKTKYLSLQNDGIVVLAGSTVDLGYFATDGGYMPVTAPGDTAATSSGLGTVDGTSYTAGDSAGTDRLSLYSASTGAAGMGNIQIIQTPTLLKACVIEYETEPEDGAESKEDAAQSVSETKKITETKTVVTSIKASPGDTVQLGALAYYYGLEVSADAAAAVYTVTGDIGTVSETGLYTVGLTSEVSGTITVTLGGVSTDITVDVTGFADIAGHWAKDYITQLADNKIVAGITSTTFEPESNIRRSDFVLMLYRAVGSPEITEASSFTDVSADSYYASAIAWAEYTGIAQGMGDGLFTPANPLTREQAFTFVYRALSVLGINYLDGDGTVLGGFPDSASVSDYALTPTATLVSIGFVSGSDGMLLPSNNLNRAQTAKILCVALENV